MKTLNEILATVEKPCRYTGGEWGERSETPSDFNYCICFPDVYEVGMSNLGIKIVCEAIKQVKGASVDRCFAPWPDFGAALKENALPLCSLGMKMPLADFDMLGFSLQYEMCYPTVLYMLDLAGIPLKSVDRGENFPIVQAGGPCVCNPEPMADFVDIFTIGDGEDVMKSLAEIALQSDGKTDFLKRASALKGVYVPRFMNPVYDANGRISAFEGKTDIEKAVVKDLDKAVFPKQFAVANTEAVFDRAVVEVMRGCYRGCRFCQAGFLYRPVRKRTAQTICDQACSLVKNAGFSELSLNSLSTGDYPELGTLLDKLNERLPDTKLSLPSLRVDSFESNYAKFARQGSVTFAPEAGTQRLRDVINKDITDEEIERGVNNAFRLGYGSIKLYFMLGLPTETDDDLRGIGELVAKIRNIYNKSPSRARSLRISVSVSTFIPKPFTPFEFERQATKAEVDAKIDMLKKILYMRGVTFSWNDYYLSQAEAVLARGDRKTGALVLAAYREGCVFDGWSSMFKAEKWKKAYADSSVDPLNYTREYAEDELMPWDFINIFVDKKFLISERHKSREGIVSGGCQSGCKACGIQKIYKCDVK